jgi:uncharacterized DUF497 family protein
MLFDWNDSNIHHIAKHGITPSEAEQVVLNDPIDIELQKRGEESRIAQVGATDHGRVLVVVSTLRNGLTRVVTAFPANRRLRAVYAAQKGKRDARRISKEELQE